MERKASLLPNFRNKKAPKAPESGTPRAGNQLVRMRSPNHSLKDMETGTAPTRHFLTQYEQHSRNARNRRPTPAPCFIMLPSGPPPLLRPPSHAPQGIQAPAIPTGTGLPHSSTVRRGIATARTKPLTPPYAKLPTTAHASPVAGHQLPETKAASLSKP